MAYRKPLIYAFPVDNCNTNKPPQFNAHNKQQENSNKVKLMRKNTTMIHGVNVFEINSLHWLAVMSYIYPAPYKTGAGICTPCKYKATPDAASVFFVVCYTRHSMAWCAYLMTDCPQAFDHATAHRAALIMVTLTGQPQGWPVPLYAGSANPVNVTAPIDICTSSGDSLNLYKEAVYHG